MDCPTTPGEWVLSFRSWAGRKLGQNVGCLFHWSCSAVLLLQRWNLQYKPPKQMPLRPSKPKFPNSLSPDSLISASFHPDGASHGKQTARPHPCFTPAGSSCPLLSSQWVTSFSGLCSVVSSSPGSTCEQDRVRNGHNIRLPESESEMAPAFSFYRWGN